MRIAAKIEVCVELRRGRSATIHVAGSSEDDPGTIEAGSAGEDALMLKLLSHDGTGRAYLTLDRVGAEALHQKLREFFKLGPSPDALAEEIRRVDGNHTLGAGQLAEALAPFLR